MTFIENLSPAWLEDMYRQWQAAPENVPADWHAFFSGFELGRSGTGSIGAAPADMDAALKQSAAQSLIYRYRDIGHLLACTDPLSPCKIDHPLLNLNAFGLSPSDLDTTVHTRRFHKTEATLREIFEVMRETYCRSLGVEFMHIQEPAERQWLIDRMEPGRNRPELSSEDQLAILEKLQETTSFEAFLNKKFMGQTRFSLEGGELLIPMLRELLALASRAEIRELVMGMPHRGRLNVLANVLGDPLENIFAQFRDNLEHGVIGDGDVKYHTGYSATPELQQGKKIHVTLVANPSHLEAIDPVVEGNARARQDRYGHDGRSCVLPVLIHGDAAFAGQGVVAETFNLSQLEGYGTGGTIHLVVNNQIGFTTLPKDARSSSYATDAAKIVMAPVFHVHGEDPEAAIQAIRLAVEYRQTFRRDVVVELICYRRYGHNEGDEPYFTQPLMYDKIKDRPSVARIYADRLVASGIPPDALAGMAEKYEALLNEAYAREPGLPDTGFAGDWSGIARNYSPVEVATGAGKELLVSVAETLAGIPSGFTPHPKVAALLQKRRDAVVAGEGIDWANAESLAFATLLHEGTSIRLSGQDVRRGTFSQRHALLIDHENGEPYYPLTRVAGEGTAFYAYDSMLSEFAVLGFEYGYSLATPNDLIIWEAQYGDFANGAQVIIDQFIASGETKWQRVSGLVILLPHGYEGQGSEHSSARIERWLQLCAGNNLQIAMPSTPAHYFHLLRRQIRQPFRKPLVIFTPKSLLRHPRCVSTTDDLSGGRFREILPAAADPAGVKILLLCSGKIYYELLECKERDRRDDVALIRLEQLYPLRTDLLREELERYPHAKELRWVQEEPKNNGAWCFLHQQLRELIGREPGYVGRREDASPAVGSHRLHRIEQEKIIDDAFATKKHK